MPPSETASAIHTEIARLMGNRFELTVVHPDAIFASHCIASAIDEIKRIEALLTTFNPRSHTNRINAMAGIRPVAVDAEVIALINRSFKLSELTEGAFDITYGSIDISLWNFDLNMKSLPDLQTAGELVRLVNYKNVVTDVKSGTVLLKEKGMRIGFGGIGKGYAADKAKALLQNMGIKSGIVNAAGDLVTWGTQPDGKPWTVRIADPSRKHTAFSSLAISNMAVATSGNYEKFVMIGGKRYSHTIDPRTGYPANGIKSVTILCPIAELADALATPVMVMGVKAGLDMINQMNGIACIVIDDNDKLYTSSNVNIH